MAIVTGASSGIGRAISDRLIGRGYRVIGADRTEAPDSGTESALDFRLCDVADPIAVKALCAYAIGQYGRVNALVNNVGFSHVGSVEHLSLDQWNSVFAANVHAMYLTIHELAPHMRAMGGGAILNIASVFGLIAQPMLAAYCSSKAAVVGLSRQVALDYARYAVRCNCLCPGLTATANIKALYGHGESLTERGKYLASTVPMGRMAEPEEIAAAAAFLISDEASFVTGATLVADGGQSIHTGPVWRDFDTP